MKILVIGDVVGKPGMEAVKAYLPKLKEEYQVDFTIVNGENSADGMGITKNLLQDFYRLGADVVTMGNHTWGKKDIFSFIDEENKLIRPYNYAAGLPGHGYVVSNVQGIKIGVLDLIGRVNTGGSYDSPFEKADEAIQKMKEEGANVIVVEIHAEATAEKVALGYYLREKANLVYGTHTHVQTADETVFETGMGYITDVGMTGPKNSIIGMEVQAALKRFLTQMPERYLCATGEFMLNGIVATYDESSNKVSKIERIRL